MFGIGFTELVLILIAALIFIGPKRMPEIAKAVGKAFMEFRKAAEGLKEQVADFGAGDVADTGLRQGSYDAGVPEGHAPAPPPEDREPEGEAAGKAVADEAPRKAPARKKAAPASKKASPSVKSSAAPKKAAKKSSKSASPGAGVKKGKGSGKSGKARTGQDDGNDTRHE